MTRGGSIALGAGLAVFTGAAIALWAGFGESVALAYMAGLLMACL